MRQDTLAQLTRALENPGFSLRNIRLPQGTVKGVDLPLATDGLMSADMIVSDGRIEWLGAPTTKPDMPDGPDLDHAMVWPLPVDCHTHLDKCLNVLRSPNPDGTFDGAALATSTDKEAHWSAEDIRRRADFALRTAYAHGTNALRSHVDASPETFDENFSTLCGLAEDWRDRLTVQLCPFTGIADGAAWIGELAAAASAQPVSGVLSIFVTPVDDLDGALDDVFKIAQNDELALDFHVDENLDPASNALDAVARASLRQKFEHPVLAGHCCALAVQADDVVDRTLDVVAEAGIGVVTLPLCNAYLMDRQGGRTPRYRGVAPVHEMKQRGIRVAIGSDNIRDGYHAYGDLNLPQVYRDAVRMTHLDHPFADWASAVTMTPADLMGLSDDGRLRISGPANFMVFDARNWPEFISRSAAPQAIVRNGRQSIAALPEFAELDDLHGMSI